MPRDWAGVALGGLDQAMASWGALSLALTLVSLTPSLAGAEEEDADTPRTSDSAHILAASLAYQAPLSIDKRLALGGGVFYTREYFVHARTALGVHVGVRFFPDEPRHLALGYGLTVKHYLGDFGETPRSGLYVLYGLLLQMNVLQGRGGVATGHDTRLAIGYDFTSLRVSPMFEAGYHLTQVRSFDQEALWWPYTELVAGLRF